MPESPPHSCLKKQCDLLGPSVDEKNIEEICPYVVRGKEMPQLREMDGLAQ